MGKPALYRELFLRHWNRIKQIDFPGGFVAVRDHAGRPLLHREHTRPQLRDMAKLAARRDIREMRAKIRDLVQRAQETKEAAEPGPPNIGIIGGRGVAQSLSRRLK
jgi:hypothetical protein